ncbi:MltA domain-containing protein [Xanthobacter sp. VTT E-85241]|uniref:murein transglycosylase A n=1 Tax=Roseixanthobacter finlandensis TaxID=3119922 RepID=UPI0037281CEF
MAPARPSSAPPHRASALPSGEAPGAPGSRARRNPQQNAAAGAFLSRKRDALSGLILAAWLGATPATANNLAGLVAPVARPEIAGARLESAAYATLPGWAQDDQSAAFSTFLASCGALRARPAEVGPPDNAALVPGLRITCDNARRLVRTLAPETVSAGVARLFFEANFRPYRIVPEKSPPGFLTGYYEPELDGALTPTGDFKVPIYGRPTDLIPTGPQGSNKGGAVRRAGDVFVPYYDRAQIEDGALAGRGLEIAYIAHPVDLFFMQIQGSARIRLPDGTALRLNYDGHNGYPYTPVGRLLIQRGLVPREAMSMAAIRSFIEQNPQAGADLMRENRSFVFFRAVPLAADAGALGAQGVPLTAGRSIAIDRALHAYGTPIFIDAALPLARATSADPFRRLMIAQDTGSAIVGPARADLFFGAGEQAAAVAGRIRHPGAFTLLVPRLQPVRAKTP